MISISTLLILVHFWMTILTMFILLYSLNVIKYIIPLELIDVILMVLLVTIAGLAWPITLLLAFLLTMISAVDTIRIGVTNINKDDHS